MKEKNRNMRYSKKAIISILAVTFLVVGITGTYMFGLMLNEDITPQEALEEIATWNRVLATNISVPNGDTGIVNILTYTHQASPYTLYDDALDEDNAYEHMDDTPVCGEELEHMTPYLTLYDYIVIIQWDYEHAHNGASWDDTLVRVYINTTCACQTDYSSELMLEGDFYDIDGTNDAKMNVYVTNSGAGQTVNQGCTFTIDDIHVEWFGVA